MLDKSLNTISYSVAFAITMSISLPMTINIDSEIKAKLPLNNGSNYYCQNFQQGSSVISIDYLKTIANAKTDIFQALEPTIITPNKTYKLNVKVVSVSRPEPLFS